MVSATKLCRFIDRGGGGSGGRAGQGGARGRGAGGARARIGWGYKGKSWESEYQGVVTIPGVCWASNAAHELGALLLAAQGGPCGAPSACRGRAGPCCSSAAPGLADPAIMTDQIAQRDLPDCSRSCKHIVAKHEAPMYSMPEHSCNWKMQQQQQRKAQGQEQGAGVSAYNRKLVLGSGRTQAATLYSST